MGELLVSISGNYATIFVMQLETVAIVTHIYILYAVQNRERQLIVNICVKLLIFHL